jgi:hypothetical protein
LIEFPERSTGEIVTMIQTIGTFATAADNIVWIVC